jgi:hypothetical protein
MPAISLLLNEEEIDYETKRPFLCKQFVNFLIIYFKTRFGAHRRPQASFSFYIAIYIT